VVRVATPGSSPLSIIQDHLDPGQVHPGEVELTHYVRGTLARNHADAVFAHCILCVACGQRLRGLLGASPGAPGTFRWRGEPRTPEMGR
jgi:hypothetical protein